MNGVRAARADERFHSLCIGVTMSAPVAQQAGAGAVTPKDAYFARMDAAMVAHRCEGSWLVVGIKQDEDEEEEEEEEEGGAEPVYTAEQVSTLRHVLGTNRRQAAVAQAMAEVFGMDGDDDMAFFNTQSGNEAIFAIEQEVKKALRKRALPERFDALFGLTWALLQHDFWMMDNECYEVGGQCETSLARLAAAWKALLCNSDAVLGIDAEFTRPGVEALLAKLADELAGVERGVEDGYAFDWR